MLPNQAASHQGEQGLLCVVCGVWAVDCCLWRLEKVAVDRRIIMREKVASNILKGSSLPQAPQLESWLLHCFVFSLWFFLVFHFWSFYIPPLSLSILHLVSKINTLAQEFHSSSHSLHLHDHLDLGFDHSFRLLLVCNLP